MPALTQHPYGSASPRTLEDLPEGHLSLDEVCRLIARREPDLSTLPLNLWEIVGEQVSSVYHVAGRVITYREALKYLCEERARMEAK